MTEIGKTLEERIAAKPGKKITLEYIESEIAEKWILPPESGTLTICVIKLNNGYFVTGESACADPANYDAGIGEELAYKHAISKLWPLFGFLLCEELYKDKLQNQKDNG